MGWLGRAVVRCTVGREGKGRGEESGGGLALVASVWWCASFWSVCSGRGCPEERFAAVLFLLCAVYFCSSSSFILPNCHSEGTKL